MRVYVCYGGFELRKGVNRFLKIMVEYVWGNKIVFVGKLIFLFDCENWIVLKVNF